MHQSSEKKQGGWLFQRKRRQKRPSALGPHSSLLALQDCESNRSPQQSLESNIEYPISSAVPSAISIPAAASGRVDVGVRCGQLQLGQPQTISSWDQQRDRGADRSR